MLTDRIMKTVQATIREQTAVLDAEEYTCFLLALAQWAEEQADRTDVADEINQYLEFD